MRKGDEVSGILINGPRSLVSIKGNLGPLHCRSSEFFDCREIENSDDAAVMFKYGKHFTVN